MGDGTTLLNPRETGEEDYAELYRARSLAAAPADPRCLSVAFAVCLGRHLSCCLARVGPHQHRLLHRVDPGHGVRHQRQPRGHLGRSLHQRLGHRHRVPAQRVGKVRHRERAARGQVVGAGLAHAAHAGHERAGHVLLVYELEAGARVGNHRLEHRQRGQQPSDAARHRLAEAVVGDLLEHRERLRAGDDAGPEGVGHRARVLEQHLAQHVLHLGLLLGVGMLGRAARRHVLGQPIRVVVVEAVGGHARRVTDALHPGAWRTPRTRCASRRRSARGWRRLR